jgi:6-pyruvoyltetrahydropterin/6-carboxytetrahydropterin synthase
MILADHYRIRVSKDYLVFAAGHFLSLPGSPCERLHGHNYRAAVEVEGPLSKEGLVCDFSVLKRVARDVTQQLDHRMMLPTESDVIRIDAEGDTVHVTMRDKQWSFPKSDCVFVPVPNTTAELLAGFLANRIREGLQSQCDHAPAIIRVELEESPGQSAFFEMTS